MSPETLAYWVAFDSIAPVGQERDVWLAALMAQANGYGGKLSDHVLFKPQTEAEAAEARAKAKAKSDALSSANFLAGVTNIGASVNRRLNGKGG